VAWQLSLTLAGAVLELCGVLLVVADVRQARGEARAVVRKSIVVRVPPAIARAKGGRATMTVEPSSVEQRLDGLDDLPGDLVNG
jgi:hypothetical protein